MRNASFKTNRRLWTWLTVIFFCASWWLPLFGKMGSDSQIRLLWEWLAAMRRDEIPLRVSLAVGAMLLAFACFSFVFSFVTGWLLHCVFVMACCKRKDEPADTRT